MVAWLCAINCNLANRCLSMSLYPCHTKGLYFHLDKRLMLSSKTKLRAAQRGSPLWHGKLNHCLLTQICLLLCFDRPREGRGKRLTFFSTFTPLGEVSGGHELDSPGTVFFSVPSTDPATVAALLLKTNPEHWSTPTKKSASAHTAGTWEVPYCVLKN